MMEPIAVKANPTTEPIDQGPRYRRAFTQLLTRIRELPTEEYQSVNLDVMSSVRTTEGVLPKIADMRDVVAQQLPHFQLELFDQLEERALALGHAQTVYESSQQPPAILQTLSDEATSAHDVALSEVNTLVKRGLIPVQALNNLKGGNGYRNLAADLFTLSETMRSNWSRISNRTSITSDELDHLENLADQINQALGIREQMPELQASAARDRQAAYTLFICAYDEVRAAIAYVRRTEDDVDDIMPSLYAGRGGGKKRFATEETTKSASPAVAPALDVASALVSAPATAVTPAVAVAAPAVLANKSEAVAATKHAAPSADEGGPYVQ
jgi:hypothetical protein